jgi:hypothetical protein
MVNRKEYERRTLDYWKTVTVRTKCILRNGHEEIPEGTLCRVTDKKGGFRLQTEPCKYCGVSVYITKVPPEDVYIVAVDDARSSESTNKESTTPP